MTVAILFAVGGLICVALSFWHEALHKVGSILLAVAVILLATGANVRM